MSDGDRDRALALDRAFRVRASARAERFRWGRALFCGELPRVWELNVMLVEGPGDGLDAATLEAEADRLQGAGGLRHRRVFVDDDELGARLAPGLVALGWQVRPFGVMVHRGTPPPAHDPRRAREIDLATLQDVHREFVRGEPYGSDDETVRQLLQADAVWSRTCGGRHFGGFDGDRPAGFLSMYSDAAGAQLQAMVTLPEARGRGLAREMMALGIETAAAAGHELTVLSTVEEVDWLRAAYTRMGFALVGRWFAFTRLPA